MAGLGVTVPILGRWRAVEGWWGGGGWQQDRGVDGVRLYGPPTIWATTETPLSTYHVTRNRFYNNLFYSILTIFPSKTHCVLVNLSKIAQ